MATNAELLESIIYQANAVRESIAQEGVWDSEELDELHRALKGIDDELTNWMDL